MPVVVLRSVSLDGWVGIRPCTDGDLDALRSRWPTTGEVEKARCAQHREGRTCLVAWHDGEPLGSCMVQWGGCLGPSARAAFPEAVEINHLPAGAGRVSSAGGRDPAGAGRRGTRRRPWTEPGSSRSVTPTAAPSDSTCASATRGPVDLDG